MRASTSFFARRKDVDGRDIGERSDAVLRMAMPGHDAHFYFPFFQSSYRFFASSFGGYSPGSCTPFSTSLTTQVS